MRKLEDPRELLEELRCWELNLQGGDALQTRHVELGWVTVVSVQEADLWNVEGGLERVVEYGSAYWDEEYKTSEWEHVCRYYFMQRSRVGGMTAHAEALRRLGWEYDSGVGCADYEGLALWRKEGSSHLDLLVFEDEALSPVFWCNEVQDSLDNGHYDLDESLKMLREIRDANLLLERVLFPGEVEG